jgi:hypothetical protein
MGVPFKNSDMDWGIWVSVATGLKAIEPVFDVAGPPAYFACANMAGAGKVAAARTAIQCRAGLKAGDVQDVSNG